MGVIKLFSQVILIAIFLSSCKSATNEEFPITNSEENNKNIYPEKKRIEMKFSCEEDGISEYLHDGWIILKENSQKKFVLGNLFPPQKIVIWIKTKGVK